MVGTEGSSQPQPHPCQGLAAPHLLRLPRTPSTALGSTRDGAPTALRSCAKGLESLLSAYETERASRLLQRRKMVQHH